MDIVTIGMIVELNNRLKERELPYKIHLSDACGAQSMRVEPLSGGEFADVSDELVSEINTYFAGQRMIIQFSPDRHAFWVKR